MKLLILSALISSVFATSARAQSANNQSMECQVAILKDAGIHEKQKVSPLHLKATKISLSEDSTVELMLTGKFANYVSIRVAKNGKTIAMSTAKSEDAMTEFLVIDGDRNVSVSCSQGNTVE